MPKKLLSTKQAAEELGVSTKTVRRWASQGKIEAVRTSGGHRRYKLKDISPQKEINFKKILPLLLSVAILSGGVTYLLTKTYYQKQLNTIKQQLETYLTRGNVKDDTISDSNSENIVDSGINVIKPEDNGSVLVDSKIVKDTSGVFISSQNQDSLIVSQIISGIGFIVSTKEEITSPIYFNWEISN